VSDTAQLVLVRGVDAEFGITKEMLGIQPMNYTFAGEDIFQESKHVTSKHRLSFYKLLAVSADGTRAMVQARLA
jgi:hypothetical protein